MAVGANMVEYMPSISALWTTIVGVMPDNGGSPINLVDEILA